MPCYHPLTGWPSRNVNPSGKRSITFSEGAGFGSPVQIACGQCIGCRLERARQWSVRIMHEAQFYDRTSFLTLTYSDDNLPSQCSADPRYVGTTLDLGAYQRFWKRVRRALGAHRVRLFGCGEYGDDNQRPHYHACLFGWDWPDKTYWKRSPSGEKLYVSEHLRELWPHGDHYIGNVTLESAGYVARYVVKKVNGDLAKSHYNGRRPEFMTCSKGIGRVWFDQYSSDVYPDDFVVFKGKRLRVPKFYDKQLPEDLLEDIKAKRLERMQLHADNNTPERLAVREEVTHARITNLKRA